MIARLSRRALLGGFAGSAATAILAACGGGSATSSPATVAAGAATVANQGGNNQAATTIPGAATNPATAGATARPINGSVGAGGATNGTASSSTSPAGTTVPASAATTSAPAAATTGSTGSTGTSAASVAAPLGTASTGAITPTGVIAKVDPNLAGALTIYTSQVQADIDMLKAAFNKVYPKITVTVYRDGTEKVLAKLRAESDAKSVQADVLFISDAPTMENLKADKLIQVYKSVNTGPVPREFVEPEGYYTGTKIINTAIAVNTTAKLPPPAAWKDLVKPDYKGKLVTPSPAYSGAAALNYTVFLNTMGYGADFLKGLKANNLTVVMANGDALNKVISGELPVGIVTDNQVRVAKAKGSPIDLIYPADGAIPLTEPIAVVAGTKNLDTAKAFVDYVLSPEGQALVVSQNYLPILPGIMGPMGAPMNVREFPVDAKGVAAQLADGKKQFADIFGT